MGDESCWAQEELQVWHFITVGAICAEWDTKRKMSDIVYSLLVYSYSSYSSQKVLSLWVSHYTMVRTCVQLVGFFFFFWAVKCSTSICKHCGHTKCGFTYCAQKVFFLYLQTLWPYKVWLHILCREMFFFFQSYFKHYNDRLWHYSICTYSCCYNIFIWSWLKHIGNFSRWTGWLSG